MRKESKKNNNVTVERVQTYHGGNWHSESYAFEGFKSNKYFTSDRYELLLYNFARKNGLPLEGFGLEIEAECFGVTDETVLANLMKHTSFSLFPDDLFKMQKDGSLGHVKEDEYDNQETCVGVECITQVMKQSFIRNHYKDFKTMFDVYFPAFKISCAKSGRCGMHVNISNAVFGKTKAKQIEAIRKLYYFVNNNYSLACKLFCRDVQNTDYCGLMKWDEDYCKTLDIENAGGDHYHCFNFSHFRSGRIELRLVGGQSDFRRFRATMETIFFLCERMKNISWDDLQDLAKVFEGCNQYVHKRLLFANIDRDIFDKISETRVHDDFDITD